MAFATTTDVATRLARTLSTEEEAAAEYLLDAVAEEIGQAVTQDPDEITDPGVLRFISVEAVCRELASPIGAQSTSESLGAYSYDVRYRETGGTFLTAAEERLARFAVYGKVSASSRPESTADEVYDYLYS